MKKILGLGLVVLFYLNSNAQTEINCVIKTTLGDIYIELYPENAPITVNNFLQYVTNKAYDNSSFFRTCTPENEMERTIKIEVIQGGNVPEEKLQDPIKIETTKQTNLTHKNGAVSMARGAPNSVRSSFFICINDQPELDFNGKRNPDGQGFAVFGKVTKGMDVVLKIQAQKNKDQYLNDPIVITSIQKID